MTWVVNRSGQVRTGKDEIAINREWDDDAPFLYDEQEEIELAFDYEVIGFSWDKEFSEK